MEEKKKSINRTGYQVISPCDSQSSSQGLVKVVRGVIKNLCLVYCLSYKNSLHKKLD